MRSQKHPQQLRSPIRSTTVLPAVTAALMAVGLVSTQAAVQTAGDLLVNVDFTAQPLGPIASIANAGTMGGVFEAGGGTPTIAAVYGTGTKGAAFDGSGFMQHKDTVGGVLIPADAGLTGANPTTSIEAWVLNPHIPGEETIVAWGHRNGGDGQNMAFNYGHDARWGAVGHWGGADIGWDSCCNSTGGSPPGVPSAGAWHHLVYTFDGATQRIYVDGVLKNQENISLNTHTAPPITIGGQLEDDAGNVTGGLRASMTIGRLRIHQEALSDAQVANNYSTEAADFSGVAPLPSVAPLHRYRFANAAGAAPNGTVTPDSIGTAHATVRGDGSTFTGTRVTIPGGSSGTQGYVDLPNGLLSINSADPPTGGSGEITFEGWTKVTGNRQWSRILDIGSSDVADPGLIGGEVPGPGGGGEGLDYLFYDAQENVNTARRNFDIRNIDGGPGPNGHPGATGGDGGGAFDTPNFDRDFHWAITWNESSGTVRVYENGNEVSSRTGAPRFSAINDVNVWLGRSNWTGDQNMQGEFDEFRIYNKELTAEEVARSAAAGAAQMHMPGEAPSFDANPQNVTVQETLPATFRVETRGAGPMTYQWFRGTDPIPGATGQSYTFIAMAADNGATFKCRATGALGSLDSTVATLTVLADTTAPALVGAAGGTGWGLNDTTFGVRFTEPVNEADAENTANYSIPGYTILGPGVLQPDLITVVFGITPSLKSSTCKVLSVSNIRDRSPSQNTIAANSQTGVIYAEGSSRYDRYNATDGNGLAFPDGPDVIAHPPNFENPEGGGDHGNDYRGRSQVLLSAPVTGAYRFYLASDDNSELFLSTDENPANKTRIAREPAWANFREWTGTAPGQGGRAGPCITESGVQLCENVSGFINLNAGCRYYMEFVFNEGGGGDYCSVAWQTPANGPFPNIPANGSASQLIGPQYISPFETAATIAASDPVDQTVSEGARVTLTANITGSPVLSIQWYSNGVAIVGATGRTHETPSMRFPDNNGDQYYVTAQNSLGSAQSRTATITVVDDATPPTVNRAIAGCGYDRITLVFNEVMDESTAEDSFNYTIDGNFPSQATLLPDGRSVELLYGPQTPGSVMTVHVETVADFAGNPIDPVDLQVSACVNGCGGVVFEAYNTGGGTAVSILTGHPTFPNSPDFRGVIPAIRSRLAVNPANPAHYNTDARENYGARMRGLFVATESGPHTFYIGADDGAELRLSTDASPANAVAIASESAWSNEREWTSSAGGSSVPAKKSAPQNLIAGELYYIEALYKEGGGGDHCAVAVQLPSMAAPPANGADEIGAANLGSAAPAGALPAVAFGTQPQDQTLPENSVVSFSVAAGRPAPFDWLPITYQWQRSDDGGANWADIGGATGTTYSFGPIALSDNGAKFRAQVCTMAFSAPSAEATLNVVPDTTPPTCVQGLVSTERNAIWILFSEFVDQASAEDEFNYSVSGASVNTATLQPDGMSVVLDLSSEIPFGASVVVTVENVTDRASNPNAINPPCSLTLTAPVVACGGILWESYPSGSSVAVDTLINHPTFPNNPDGVRLMNQFDTRAELGTDNFRDNFGARMRGLYFPPKTGRYIFYLHSDDASRLFLNPNGSSAAGKVLIAEETGCCRDWPTVASQPIFLASGRGYYIEGLYQEAGGGDYIRVAARLEGSADPLMAIPLSQLGQIAPASTIEITQQPQSQNVCLVTSGAQPPVTLSVGAAPTDNPINLLSIRWERSAGSGENAGALFSEDFTAGNGGYVEASPNGPFSAPWTYNAGTGSWEVNQDGAEVGHPMTTILTSPSFTVTELGLVRLTFQHRYSFETGGGNWDGGVVQVSINGGGYATIPGGAFLSGGYNGAVLGGSASVLAGQNAFVQDSPGHQTPAYVTSVADLGTRSPGDTVSIRFLYGGDTNTRGQFIPSWEVTSVSAEQGVGGFTPVPGATGPTFSITPRLSDDGTCYRAVLCTIGAQTISDVACLRVVQPNTAPRFDCGPNQVTAEDSGPQSVAFASNISPHSVDTISGTYDATFDSGPPAQGPAPYCVNFNSGLPPGTASSGVTPPYVGPEGALHLSDRLNSQHNFWSVPSLAPFTVTEFQASWKTKLTGVGGADGFSFNLGTGLGTFNFGVAEEGCNSGLSVCVDTFDNGDIQPGGEVGIDIKWNGAQLGFLQVAPAGQHGPAALMRDVFVDTSVTVDSTGFVTFKHDTFTVTGTIPGYTGLTIDQYLFGARTGGANENAWIDDLCISAPPVQGLFTVAGATLYGNAYQADGVLHITDAANGQIGSIIVDNLLGASPLGSFTMTFDALLGEGTAPPADGIGVSIANNLPNGAFGEEGAGTGLTVAFDSFDNGGGEAPAIDVYWNGVVIAHTPVPGGLETGGQFVPISIRLDPDGTLDVVAAGNPVYTDLPTGFIPIPNARFGIGGRTGGLNEKNWIDNLHITAVSPSAGDAEANQIITFIVSNDNPGLFSQQPAIAADGTLTYTAAPNACGSANVTVVAMDNGGIDPICGGDDTSEPCNFSITVTPVNDCPVTGNQSVDVNEDSSVAITIPMSDVDANGCGASPATCSVVVPPVNGTLSGTCPNFTYTPTPGYPGGCGHNNGSDSFTVAVTDGECTVLATVNIRVIEVNDCPDANVVVTKTHPIPGLPGTFIISCNNSNGCFILNGTSSSDVECDPITYAWYYGNSAMPFSIQAVTTNCFPLGEHDITLVVSDPQCSGSETVHLTVISACEAIEALIDDINSSVIERKNKRPMLASLKAACASFERGSMGSGKNQLGAFINKVRAQIQPANPVEAARWTAAAQNIIDSINACEELHRHGNNGLGNGEDPPPPGWVNPGNPHHNDPPHDP